MIMAVDIGNTHIKMGAWDEDSLVFVSRLQTNLLRTRDEYAIDLLNILRLQECNSTQFDGAIISSVVPALSRTVQEAVGEVVQTKRIYLVGPGLKTGLDIKIDDPATLGSDMVCAAVAALHKFTMPCIIISMGTATAVFALDKDGAFLGGSVCAGVNISLEALSRRTAQLPLISLEEPGNVIGTNTVDSIKSGVIYGTAGMLDSMVERFEAEIGPVKTIVACGGHARHIVPHCRREVILEEQLVLEGLRLIYHKNAKS